MVFDDDDDACFLFLFLCFPAPRTYGFVLTGFWLGSIFTVTAGTDSNAVDDEADDNTGADTDADTSAVEEGDGEDPE